jgi:hypothetical protein
MKNVLTNLFNSSIFRFAQRLTIVCLFLSYAFTATAGNNGWSGIAYGKAEITSTSTGEGTVYVNQSENPSGKADDSKGISDSSSTSATFWWHAVPTANSNSAFAGWYKEKDASGTVHESKASFSEAVTGSSDNKNPSQTYYAHFKKIITPRQAVIDWTKTDEEETLSTTVDLYKAEKFLVQSVAHTGGESRNFTCTASTSTDYATLTLTAGADVVDGDQFVITLVADHGGKATITVNIKSRITVTFLHPSVGKGSYQAVQTNADGAVSCNLGNSDTDKEMSFTKTNQFYHTFTATPHADYNLYRWVITHEDASVVYSTENPMTYTLQDGDKISVEFLPKNMAQFMVKGVPNVYYHKLEDAITAAQSASSKTVVVYTSGTLYNEHITPSADGKYEFTIPSGITLLVPGDAAYTVTKELREEDLSNNTTAKPTCYKYLTLTPNTRIIANGDICVYAKTSYVMGYDGKPSAYGKIDMKDQTEIVLNSGSQLTVFGYITGNPTTSRVLAKDGSKVYESFQFTDWPGGSNAMKLIGNDQRVFPIKQFYIQSIETKLTLQSGAEEYVASAVNIKMGIDIKIPLNMIFIAKDTGSDSDKGFMCLNEGAELSKWYDGVNDRQVYQINKMEGYSGIRDAKIGIMYAELSIAGKLNSEDYVLATNNNMDISLYDVRLTSVHDLAFMADSKLYIDPSSECVFKGNIFVYDKEANDVGFYGASESKLMPITYTAYHNAAPGKRTAAKVTDAQIIVDGKLIVQDGGDYGSGFFTTAENPLASNITYGARITSNGGGLVDFQVLEKPEHYQMQGSTPITMPISYARLRNGDNTYSAGESMTEPSKYYYYKEEERWLVPQFGITNPTNNEFTVTLPQAKQQEVICKVTTEGMTSDISKSTFTIALPANSRFTYDANSHGYTSNAEGGELSIPLTYNPVNIDNTGAPYTETMTISYTYYDVLEGQNVTRSTNVTLIANENYTPDFTVTIAEKDVTIEKQYTFAQTAALNALPATVVITPVANTVATLPGTTWQGVAAASPTFTTTGSAPTGLSVVYTPQSAGDHTGTLTITATYTDDASKQIKKDIVINLNGTGRLQDNTLAFQQDLIDGYTIDQGLTYQNIFANLGNGNNVTFTCTYVGGDVDEQDASALVTVSATSGNYTIKANEVESITETRMVKVVASQAATTIMNSTNREIVLTVVPPAIWNWSDLYFGQTYTNPVTPSRADAWSLTEIDDPNNMVGTLQGDYTNYSAVIANGDVNTVYEARFKFKQGINEKEFTSKIYADPRVLGFCVDASHKYKGVTKSATGGVSFDDTNDRVTLKPGAQWVIQMIGMPDKITFMTNGENLWNIEQRASESSAWSSVATWSNLGNGAQSFSLLPTTRFVRITYGSTNPESIGQLSEVCISKLSVKADVDEIYLPINKDGSTSSKTVVLTHTDASAPSFSTIDGLTYSTSTSGNLGTAEEPYYQTTLIITTPSTFAIGNYTLTATQQGTEEVNIPVYADFFPQGLPIKLATDDVKRYHFVATASDNVSWDANTKQVVLQNPGGSVARSVVLTFEGAPSRISFTASRDIIDSEWKIYESVDGTDGSFVESSLINRDTEAGPTFTHNLQYTTRYVRIYYYSDNQTEVRLSNLVIEGDPMLLVNPEELEFSTINEEKTLTLTAINLNNIRIELDNVTDFQMSHGTAAASASYTLSSADYPNALGVNKVGDIEINTKWITNSIVNDGMITIYNVDDNDSILAKVKLVGAGKYLHKADAKTTGLYTGIPDGTKDTDGDGNPNDEYKYTFHGADYKDYLYHQVDLTNAFAEDGTALFDYLFVYGETTTTDSSNDITAPRGESGSNARTPYYVYIRDVDAYGNFDRYRFVTMLDNANIGRKDSLHVPGVTTYDSTLYVNVPKDTPIRVYITGFCPYASTGADKFQEGVFFFRGMAGSKLDVYLEDAYIFARNKMLNGQPFYTRGDKRNPSFTEGYARGSGGVLVFECVEKTEDLLQLQAFDVTIHTVGNSLLKSNYGCFNYFFGMDPFQISAPIHVRLHSRDHVSTSKTVVNFTDEWPTALNADRSIKTSRRTNGFLSLQKLNNNAPSIDLGNPLTEVNFRGGQVELQNAQIVSENYKTTLAISYRSGEYGGDQVGLKFAEGIGTDAVGGTVNFYDGTITIQPMWVAAEYKDYYLIDKDVDGNEIKEQIGVDKYGQPIYRYLTTCLRTPKNTKVYGGSICWLRACQHVTSKGGAPTDNTGKLLGQYVYEFGGTDTKNDAGLVTSIKFPAEVGGLANYYNTYHPNRTYGIESVTPDADNKLYFWIPDGFGGVEPEKDNILTTWKACMTEISAGFGTLKGTVGGPTPIESGEEIKYMLYCKIDENIKNVITAGEGEGEQRVYSYSAPVKVPDVAQSYIGGKYTTVNPSMVGQELQNEVLSDTSYLVTDRIYYVTNTTADLWQTFTAPFDVEKIWVVETFSEEALKQVGDGTRDTILISQAHHNADFAAFFGVSMAIGTTEPLETIFKDFVEWGKLEDQKDTLPDGSQKPVLYNGVGDYTLRGKYELIPYYRREDGSANWDVAHFYLNENEGDWQLSDDGFTFNTTWKMLTEEKATDGVLLEKGKTYSMMFPYCTGCGDDLENREYWDYWSGKFLIFESTDGTKTGGHIIDGSNLFDSVPFARFPESGQAIVSGNSTFAYLETSDPEVYIYQPNFRGEVFMPNIDFETQEAMTSQIKPTTAFLWTNLSTPSNVRVRSIARTGEIEYVTDEDPNNNGNGTATGGNMPTVSEGHSLFITKTVNGINIAVAQPQHVRVLSSTGVLLYNGMVPTAVDVALPTAGVYVITGENEVQKILMR